MEDKPWTILGAGAIGGLWACHLQQAGLPVQLILRNDAALQQYRQAGGLVLENGWQTNQGTSTKSSLHLIPALSQSAIATDNIDNPEQIKRLIICTKSYQTMAAIEPLIDSLQTLETIVLLQNGLGMADLLQAQFPRARLCLATTTEGAWRRSPFHLVHAGKGITLFAEQDKTALDELLNTQLAAETRPNINAVLWEKLCINSVINPLCVMHRCKNGELLNIAKTQRQITQLLKELVSISEAASYPEVANTLGVRVIEIIEKTANNQCSMWQDVQNKRPTEIDAICGYALSQAEKFGIDCPNLEQAYQFIQDVEAGY